MKKKSVFAAWVLVLAAVFGGPLPIRGENAPYYAPRAKEICARRMPSEASYAACLKMVKGATFSDPALQACDHQAPDAGTLFFCMRALKNRFFQSDAVALCERHAGAPDRFMACMRIIRGTVYAEEDLDHCATQPLSRLNACLDILPR